MNSTVPVTMRGFWYSSPIRLPISDIGEETLVRLEILFVLDVFAGGQAFDFQDDRRQNQRPGHYQMMVRLHRSRPVRGRSRLLF